MKKVKIMLLTIALIAIAAGTLAFKARYNTNFCTKPALETSPGVFTCKIPGATTSVTCDIPVLAKRLTVLPGVNPVCTTFLTTTEEDGPLVCEDSHNCALGKPYAE